MVNSKEDDVCQFYVCYEVESSHVWPQNWCTFYNLRINSLWTVLWIIVLISKVDLIELYCHFSFILMIQSTGGDVLTIGNKQTMDLPSIKIAYVAIHQFAGFHGHKITVSKITTTRHEDYEKL